MSAAPALGGDRPVVVYCNDLQCDMSPRAVWRLERLGYPPVDDYVAGGLDWLSFGLPHQGSAVLAGDQLQRDVPTCTLDESVDVVSKRLGDTVARAWSSKTTTSSWGRSTSRALVRRPLRGR